MVGWPHSSQDKTNTRCRFLDNWQKHFVPVKSHSALRDRHWLIFCPSAPISDQNNINMPRKREGGYPVGHAPPPWVFSPLTTMTVFSHFALHSNIEIILTAIRLVCASFLKNFPVFVSKSLLDLCCGGCYKNVFKEIKYLLNSSWQV